jgi:hypothetical protein
MGLRLPPLSRQLAGDGGLEEGLAVAGEAALGAAQGRHPGIQLAEQLLQLGHDAALLLERRERNFETSNVV